MLLRSRTARKLFSCGGASSRSRGRATSSRESSSEGADRSTFKKKKAIHWLAASPVQVATDIVEGQCGHSQYGDVVPCTLVEYDYLLAKNKLDENDELNDPGVMTPVSKVETAAWADPMLKLISQGESQCMNQIVARVLTG